MRFCLLLTMALCLSPVASSAGETLMFGGGIEVKDVDLDALLLSGPEDARNKVVADHKQLLKLLRQIYLIRALSEEAEKNGLGDSELFQAKLRRQREKLLYLERLKQIDAEPIPDFEQAAKEQYQGNPDAYTIPERFEAKHILISTTDRLPKHHPKEEALEIIKKVKAELDSGQSTFEDLVMAYSEDTVTLKNQGSLGLFKPGSMVKPFDEAVAAMHKPGEISDIVETKFGYHIIKLVNRYSPQKLTFDQVKEKIVAKMKSDFIQNRRDEYFDGLLKKNKAGIYEDKVEAYAQKQKQQSAE
ncbi:MAG: peptidylprolyl isomerase [Candidatus Thiodiazotropha endolucinida]